MESGGRSYPCLATKYLPSMGGNTWNNSDERHSFTEAQRLDIKHSKIDIKIIKRESSPQTKFDLFQRLNSYGSQLNAQELRPALLVAISSQFFADLERLASYSSFKDTIQFGGKQIEERFDLELVSRFIVLHNWPSDELKLTSLRDLSQVLDDKCVGLATSYPHGMQRLIRVFKQTFDIISNTANEDVFRRWDEQRNEFRGPFLTSAFEIFALGSATVSQTISLTLYILSNLRKYCGTRRR